MMKIFNFKGFGDCSSKCGYGIKESITGGPVVILMELQDNPGTSVINAAELIANQIWDELLKDRIADPKTVVWVEYTQGQPDSCSFIKFETIEYGRDPVYAGAVEFEYLPALSNITLGEDFVFPDENEYDEDEDDVDDLNYNFDPDTGLPVKE